MRGRIHTMAAAAALGFGLLTAAYVGASPCTKDCAQAKVRCIKDAKAEKKACTDDKKACNAAFKQAKKSCLADFKAKKAGCRAEPQSTDVCSPSGAFLAD